MKTFDKDQRGLSHQEFANFIVNFASSAGTPIVDMVDFMLVLTALKENTAAEEDYMKQLMGNGKIGPYWYG